MKESSSSFSAEDISTALKQTNKAIRQRAVLLAILMIISGWLLYSRMAVPHATISDGYKWQMEFLEKMRDVPDLKGFLEEDYNKEHIRNWNSLLYRLEKSNFKDRMPIVEELELVYQQAHLDKEDVLDQKLVIGGLNIPLFSWVYFLPIILLILFHDLVSLIRHHRALHIQFKRLDLEEIAQGPELFGFPIYFRKDLISIYMELIGKGIAFIFLLSPLVTAIISVKLISYYTTNVWLIFGEASLAILIGVDLLIIFYEENTFGFNTLINILWGKNYYPDLNKRRLSIYGWISLPFFVGTLNFLTPFISTAWYSVYAEPIDKPYLSKVVLWACALAISLWLCNLYPKNTWFKLLRFILIAVNFYWLIMAIYMIYQRNYPNGYYYGFYELAIFTSILTAISLLGYFLFLKRKSLKK